MPAGYVIPIRIKKDSWGDSQDRTSVIRFLNRESDSGGREMAAPVKVTREEHAAQDLRRLGADLKDAGHARRLQAISFVLDGWSRSEAAAFADVGRQTLRDWVERYNVLISPEARSYSDGISKGGFLKKRAYFGWTLL